MLLNRYLANGGLAKDPLVDLKEAQDYRTYWANTG
jgi:hypothetical protein